MKMDRIWVETDGEVVFKIRSMDKNVELKKPMNLEALKIVIAGFELMEEHIDLTEIFSTKSQKVHDNATTLISKIEKDIEAGLIDIHIDKKYLAIHYNCSMNYARDTLGFLLEKYKHMKPSACTHCGKMDETLIESDISGNTLCKDCAMIERKKLSAPTKTTNRRGTPDKDIKKAIKSIVKRGDKLNVSRVYKELGMAHGNPKQSTYKRIKELIALELTPIGPNEETEIEEKIEAIEQEDDSTGGEKYLTDKEEKITAIKDLCKTSEGLTDKEIKTGLENRGYTVNFDIEKFIQYHMNFRYLDTRQIGQGTFYFLKEDE